MSVRNPDDPQLKVWRRTVKKRDRHKCQFPECRAKTKLQAHHVIRWADNIAKRYDVTNGITLCKSHHKIVTGNEDAYIALFTEIVSKKKHKI